jgi:hypothetical protein
VSSKCGADLLGAGLFPNAKEVTESFACFDATTHLPDGFEWNRPEITVFVIGDGHKPRTAATFALRTKWTAFSIDPVLAPKSYTFQRLNCRRMKIEEFPEIKCQDPVLIVLPHSHADINVCLEKIKAPKRAVITIDCCVRNIIKDKAPDIEYVDENIWSPQNLIRVWRQV